MFGTSWNSRIRSSRLRGNGARTQGRGTRLRLERLEDRTLLSAVPGWLQPCNVTVMSQNLYVGADLAPVLSAITDGDANQIVAAATQFWQDVQATDFAERAESIANEIQTKLPDLIGLQEVSLFQTGDPYAMGSTPDQADTVALDYLQILEDALASRGLDYTVVAVTTEASAEVPTADGLGMLQNVRLTDRDVILARTDAAAPPMQFANIQEENFVHNVEFTVGAEEYTLLRGWNSVDVTLPDRQFRFINAHLETPENRAFEAVQLVQALELLNGPVRARMSVILVGDFNAPANSPLLRPGSLTYRLLVGTGFRDAWRTTHANSPGYTYGNEADLLNPTPMVVDPQRIDLVLYRGSVSARGMDRVGIFAADRTPSGLWPSDHAGVVATLAVRGLPPALRTAASVVVTRSLPSSAAATVSESRPLATAVSRLLDAAQFVYQRVAATLPCAAIGTRLSSHEVVSASIPLLLGDRVSRVVSTTRGTPAAPVVDRILASLQERFPAL